MKFVALMSGVSQLQEHPWQNFTYVSVGVGPLPMRFGLNLKCTHETGSTRSRKVLAIKALAIKAHVNTWVVMCK